MNLVSIRLIAADIDRMIKFYEKVIGISMTQYTPDFVELKTKTATLAIGSTRTLQFFGGENVAQASQNRSAIIEFMVEDVDHDYERLEDYLQPYLAQKPTTMPWGNRSLLFRDPEGNLVNLFTPISQEAVIKFENKK